MVPLTIDNQYKEHKGALGTFIVEQRAAPSSYTMLPNDIIQSNIMMQMDIEQLSNYCQSNDAINKLCHSKTFWTQKFNHDNVNRYADNDTNYASDIMNKVDKILKNKYIFIGLKTFK